jgi:hypothetical protein
MYQYSRAIYRELVAILDESGGVRRPLGVRLALLRACESAVERLVADRDCFARPAHTLFSDVRWRYPVCRQAHVYRAIEVHMDLLDEYVASLPRAGLDAEGRRIQCRALTRRGTPCRRVPHPSNGYCPSHQHLATTEYCEADALAA